MNGARPVEPRWMHAARRSFRVLVSGAICVAAACADVPTLVFDDEGGSDSTEAGLVDSAADAGFVDEANGAVIDAASCPDQAPAGASVCCGAVACNGNCTAPQCTVCQMQCGVGTLCCAKTNNVACRPMGSSCP